MKLNLHGAEEGTRSCHYSAAAGRRGSSLALKRHFVHFVFDWGAVECRRICRGAFKDPPQWWSAPAVGLRPFHSMLFPVKMPRWFFFRRWKRVGTGWMLLCLGLVPNLITVRLWAIDTWLRVAWRYQDYHNCIKASGAQDARRHWTASDGLLALKPITLYCSCCPGCHGDRQSSDPHGFWWNVTVRCGRVCVCLFFFYPAK